MKPFINITSLPADIMWENIEHIIDALSGE